MIYHTFPYIGLARCTVGVVQISFKEASVSPLGTAAFGRQQGSCIIVLLQMQLGRRQLINSRIGARSLLHTRPDQLGSGDNSPVLSLRACKNVEEIHPPQLPQLLHYIPTTSKHRWELSQAKSHAIDAS